MNRRHHLFLALLIGVAAVAGLFAAARTVSLGNASRASTDAAIVQRSRALDRYEAALRRALVAPATPAARIGAPPVRIVYHRPPPIVVTTHRAGGEHEGSESGSELDD
jgi:hypothetical protein